MPYLLHSVFYLWIGVGWYIKIKHIEMKTFKDLQFEEHPSYPYFDKWAKITFPNKYGVSVISGRGAYSSDSEPYEVGILYEGELTYTSGITEDVIGHQTKEQVTEIMKQVQELE